jgi:hypothetical protein
VLGFKPRAQSGIEDLRLILPEIRRQIALDLQMIQLQFNEGYTAREITLNVARANVQSCNSTTLALRFDYHKPALKVWNDVSLGNSVARSHCGTLDSAKVFSHLKPKHQFGLIVRPFWFPVKDHANKSE